MTNRHAIIIGGVVDNVIIWDGVADWTPPAGAIVVALDADEQCEIGWTYDAKQTPRFAAP